MEYEYNPFSDKLDAIRERNTSNRTTDKDGDTYIDVEENLTTPDQDVIRFYTSGTKRFWISKNGDLHMKIGAKFYFDEG